MTESLRLLSTPGAVTEALTAAAEWAADFDVCTPSVDSHLGRWPLWNTLFHAKGARPKRAFVALDAMGSEPHALEDLHRLGVLRLVPAADGSFRTHVLRFRRGGRVRIFLGSGALLPAGHMAPLEAATLWEGDARAQHAVEVESVFARAAHLAHVPDPEELRAYSRLYLHASPLRDELATLAAPLSRRTAFDGEPIELELVVEKRVVREAMRTLKRQMVGVATSSTFQSIGFHGGTLRRKVHWSAPLGLWSLCGELDNRYWNSFGVGRPDGAGTLAITVEVNPPLDGVNRRTGGAIARAAGDGKLYLVHRGRIGGGQKGIGAELFWSRFRGGVPLREPGRQESSRVVIVGELGAESFPRDAAAFVHTVRRIKQAATG